MTSLHAQANTPRKLSSSLTRALAASLLIAYSALNGMAHATPSTVPNAAELHRLPIKAELTKKTTSFQIKNLYAFRLPDNLPPDVNFRGLVGTISTTSAANPALHGAVNSETLFGLAYTTQGNCPVSGQTIGSYAEIYARFPSQGLAGLILKQARPGTETFPVALLLPERLPMHIRPGGCIFLSFDGTDFANLPYTMRTDLQLLYDTGAPRWTQQTYSGLDSEFIVTPSTARGPVLNAYAVLPVSRQGPIHPGKVISLYGNVSATAPAEFAKIPAGQGIWSVRDIVVIYKHNSCQRAFPGHSPNKFMWNDRSGNGHAPNPSMALGPDAVKLLEVVLTGNGLDSVMKQANAIDTVPAEVEEGDCVAIAILPNAVNPAINGAVNVETQIKVVSTP
ncbi:hypothetical protein [Asaia bogorensis]|uniref:Uncharacterized protein n=1 Tax=Asaia bogorensis NBRC 16594 TaxID=1231624 RepID=A0AAN4R2J9_9PROT|nr:hypothetical protein [Asaia bogorensis]BAT19546.1 hypothetical protein Asbog_01272 [Asaia bogorensis NBRC 16594]GBQ78447.1 hypothetical protein AA0311_1779 [Asaia bogorensis NBRC 16594]GEL53958.1 hypothetical protein ABO01nite_19650 [Asaia bogorensis NBRC 16594]